MSEKKELMQAISAVNEALIKNDIDAIRVLFHPEYMSNNIRGEKEDLETVINAYQPGGVKLQVFETRDIEIKIIDNIAFVSGIGYIRGTYESYDFEHHIRFLDIYFYGNGEWKYYLSQGTELP